MIPLELTPADGILYGSLGISTLAFGWLALRGWSAPGDVMPDAIAAARNLLGRQVFHERRRRSILGSEAERLAGSFRFPTSAPKDGRNQVPADIEIAFDLLCAGLDSPDAAPGPAAKILGERRAGRTPEREAIHGYRHHVEKIVEDVLRGHAWWETALVEMLDRCRAAGSWVAPAHLDPFLVGRPDLAAALRATHGGTVAPEGAGIIAHWQAERALRFRIREPRLDTALEALKGVRP
jgi:hypothetical protein